MRLVGTDPSRSFVRVYRQIRSQCILGLSPANFEVIGIFLMPGIYVFVT